MRFIRRAFLIIAATFAFNVSNPSAQGLAAIQPPAHVSDVRGVASIDRDNQSEEAVLNMPLVAGDRLATRRGRLEILFPDGSALALDEFSSAELQAPTLLRITEGRGLLTVGGGANRSTIHFQIDTPAAAATTDGPGDYLITILSTATGEQTEFAVLSGAGALLTADGAMSLQAGQKSVAVARAPPSPPRWFAPPRVDDAFYGWASTTRQARVSRTTSAPYLPSDLQMYGGAFDRAGSWTYEAPYGNVWYPAVPHEWRPYVDGYWSAVPGYGWTWIGVDAWTWPTHHYGRWGQSRNRWFWIPDHRWASAWVSWAAAPGYVSWCPLGLDNRPVYALAGGIGMPRTGWVVVPRRDFGRGRDSKRHAVSPLTIPANTRFAVQRTAPVPVTQPVTAANASLGPGNLAGRDGATGAGASRIGPSAMTGARDRLVARQPRVVQPSEHRFRFGDDSRPGQPSVGLERRSGTGRPQPTGTTDRHRASNGTYDPAASESRRADHPYQVPPTRSPYQPYRYRGRRHEAPAATAPAQPPPAAALRVPSRAPDMLSTPLGPPATGPTRSRYMMSAPPGPAPPNPALRRWTPHAGTASGLRPVARSPVPNGGATAKPSASSATPAAPRHRPATTAGGSTPGTAPRQPAPVTAPSFLPRAR